MASVRSAERSERHGGALLYCGSDECHNVQETLGEASSLNHSLTNRKKGRNMGHENNAKDRIAVVTDSAAALHPELVERLSARGNFVVVPMPVTIRTLSLIHI